MSHHDHHGDILPVPGSALLYSVPELLVLALPWTGLDWTGVSEAADTTGTTQPPQTWRGAHLSNTTPGYSTV